MMFVVTDPGEGGEDREQSTTNLDQRLDQAKVAGHHPLVEVDDAEPHTVGGEARVAGDETQSHVMKS